MRLPPLLVVVWFLVCSLSFFQVPTSAGVHCATAQVQTVQREVRDKCGCLVAVKAEKPKPGDKAFVQCRCAEKKTADTTTTASTKFELIVADLPVIDLPGALQTPRRRYEYLQPELGRSTPPDTLPPALA